MKPCISSYSNCSRILHGVVHAYPCGYLLIKLQVSCKLAVLHAYRACYIFNQTTLGHCIMSAHYMQCCMHIKLVMLLIKLHVTTVFMCVHCIQWCSAACISRLYYCYANCIYIFALNYVLHACLSQISRTARQ